MATSSEEYVVIFPFMAQGHIIPSLALSSRIERKTGYNIFFVSTPLNVSKLRSSPLPPNSTIRFVELPFCSSDHGLPPNLENTEALSGSLFIRFFQASLSLKPAFKRFISDIINEHCGRPPLCIIADAFFGWTVDVANEFGVFHAIFEGGGAYGNAAYFSLWLQLPQIKNKTDIDEFELPDFPHEESSPPPRIHRSKLNAIILSSDGTDPWSVFLQGQLSSSLKSDGMLFNTVEELDRTGLQYFKRKTGRPVWAIGPTLSSRPNKESDTHLDSCIKWLDDHEPNSVLYVCFGSQSTTSQSQTMELAMALEASGKNFIWVFRPPVGLDMNSEFKAEEWLPEGFEERMNERNRGLLVRKWAPQLEILSHKSTCAFLSHCGWNSVIEALNNGVVIIGWPMGGEQFYNAKFLAEEVGVCVEVDRRKDGEVRHEGIARVIELVMNETGEGKEMKRRACEVKEMIRDAIRDEEGYKGSSVKALDEFFDSVKSRREARMELNK